jgi:transcriptional regulator with XRE-family HTH domain
MARRPAPKRLGEKLLQIRTALGLSQAGIVKRLDYQESPLYASQISNFEQGKREPPLQILLRYARAANVSTDVLIDDALDLPEKLPAKQKHKT